MKTYFRWFEQDPAFCIVMTLSVLIIGGMAGWGIFSTAIIQPLQQQAKEDAKTRWDKQRLLIEQQQDYCRDTKACDEYWETLKNLSKEVNP